MPRDSFTVNWNMTNPIEPQDQYEWHELDFEEQILDNENNWPSGTVAAISTALALNLNRKCKWKYKSSMALAKASSIYKRGVSSRDNTSEFHKGAYTVDFEEDESEIINIINSYDSLILDYNFYKNWKHLLESYKKPLAVFELTEATKNLESFTKISKFIRSTKSKSVGVFGGGILCDTGAFAAKENNVEFDLIPTTTLSMIDACIGGKCGVNFFPYGKNLIGLFAFPRKVIIYKKFLNSLRSREFKAGIYEGIKHCILSGDKELFKELIKSIETGQIDDESLRKVIKVKSDVIEKDANESSLRATLNLGHTLAHAIEAHAYDRHIDIMHGEAVLFGLLFAIKLSQLHLNLDSFDLESKLIQLTQAPELVSINKFISQIEIEDVYPAILNDKKNEKNTETSQWILMQDWAHVNKEGDSYLSSVRKNSIEKCLGLFKKSLI